MAKRRQRQKINIDREKFVPKLSNFRLRRKAKIVENRTNRFLAIFELIVLLSITLLIVVLPPDSYFVIVLFLLLVLAAVTIPVYLATSHLRRSVFVGVGVVGFLSLRALGVGGLFNTALLISSIGVFEFYFTRSIGSRH